VQELGVERLGQIGQQAGLVQWLQGGEQRRVRHALAEHGGHAQHLAAARAEPCDALADQLDDDRRHDARLAGRLLPHAGLADQATLLAQGQHELLDEQRVAAAGLEQPVAERRVGWPVEQRGGQLHRPGQVEQGQPDQLRCAVVREPGHELGQRAAGRLVAVGAQQDERQVAGRSG
jgi:hypothetical protein